MGRAHSGSLLERDELLPRLGESVDAAGAGAGSLVLIAGEAGAGKTSLLPASAARDSLAGTADLWLGHCDPLSTPRPLSPLLDIAAQPDAGLDDLIGDGEQPYDLFARFLARLRDAPRPVVVAIEDAHWADDATLDLLRFLGRRVATARAVVAVTYRDDEVGPEHPLRAVIGELVSQPATLRLDVAPLSLEAVRILSERSGGDIEPERLHAVTGGNAFYVTEVLQSGVAVPSSIADVIRSRMMRSEPSARAVIEAVAIAPRQLHVHHVNVLTGSSPSAVDAAVGSGVILAVGDTLRFRHELARLAVEGSMPAPRRLALHGRMLDILVGESSNDHALLAHHAKHAGEGALVLLHAREAARLASARGAHRQAVELYADAAAHSAGESFAEQVALWTDLSQELYLVDRQEESLAAARRAEEVAEASGDELLRGRARLWVGRAIWNTGGSVLGRSTVEEAMALLEEGGPSDLLTEALYLGSLQSMLARHHGVAMERAERALSMARALGSTYLTGRALIALGTAELVTGDADRGVALLLEAQSLGLAVADDRIVSSALGMLGSGGGEVRRYEAAFGWLEEAIEHARAHDLDYTAAYDRAWQARIRFEQGRWDEAAELAREPASLPRSAQKIAPMTALGTLGRVRVRRGDPEAEEPLRRALAVAVDAELQHRWPALCGLAELAWLRQQPERAIAVLAGAYEEAVGTDSAWARGEIGFWMWRAGGIDEAAPRAALPFAAMMSGDWQTAAAEWRVIGCPYEEALALGDGDDDALLAALAIFDGLGARPAAQWLRGRLHDRGLQVIPHGPRPTTRANIAGLTARQAEVLDLICDGLANAEIAARLYISKKTVEHHVAAILSKLGVGTRTEAMAAGRRLREGTAPSSG